MKKIALTLNLNSKIWIFFGACLAFTAGAGYWFYTKLWVEYSAQIKQMDSNLEIKRGKLRQILAQKQRLSELEAEIELASKDFAKLKEMFPDEEVIPRRLIDLTTVTRRSQTLPTKFLPLLSQEKEFYRENHYTVVLKSSFHGLGSLFSEVANFRYPTAIHKMQIEKATDLATEIQTARDHGEIPRTITATFELTTFTSKK